VIGAIIINEYGENATFESREVENPTLEIQNAIGKVVLEN